MNKSRNTVLEVPLVEMEKHGGAASMQKRHIFVSGPPGIGKTLVCKRVLSLLKLFGVTCDGFFTEEIRSSTNNKRIGFDIVPIKNPENRLPLARAVHVLSPDEHLETNHRVGKYMVFVKNFEQIALPVFQTNSDVLLIDEIGRMELFSKLFIDKVNGLVIPSNNEEENKISRCILATIPERLPSLLEKIPSHPLCRLEKVTPNNRDSLPVTISRIIRDMVKNK